MKCVLAVCVLVVIAVSVQAAPGWTDRVPASTLLKGVEDIVITDCSKPDDPAKIISVTVTPDPPKIGQDITIKATFSLSEKIPDNKDSKIRIKISWEFIKVIDDTLPLCEVAKDAGEPCPLEGTFTVEVTKPITFALPGSYTGDIEVTDENGQELACIRLQFKL